MKGRPSFPVARTIGCFSASGWRFSKRGGCSVATKGIALSRENGRAKCSVKVSIVPTSVLVLRKGTTELSRGPLLEPTEGWDGPYVQQ
jgi:hypothetical protein